MIFDHMRNLLNKPIIEMLRKYPQYFIFLDFDGTLSPIARTPDSATLPGSTKKIIYELSKCGKVKLAVISGRKLSDIRRIVGIRNIIYAGNHGMEIEGKGIKRILKAPKLFVAAKRKIINDIQSKIKGIKGIFIEDNGCTIAVHYRLAAPKDRVKIKRIFYRAVTTSLFKGQIKIRKGKMLFEVRPNIKWDKGKAVKWLLHRASNKKVLPIYIGDDVTDADAFRALKNRGLMIFVGRKAEYGAKYYLRNTNDVRKFLLMIKKEFG